MKGAGWEEDFFHTLPEDDKPHDTRGDVRIEAGGRAHGPVHLFSSTAETRGYLGLTTQPVLSCNGLSQPRASPPHSPATVAGSECGTRTFLMRKTLPTSVLLEPYPSQMTE